MGHGVMAVKRKREYDASGRREQARRNRDRIVDAAERRFLGEGYGATTVAAIAIDAGVSDDTVYKAFGGKAGLVRAIRGRALEGAGSFSETVRSLAQAGVDRAKHLADLATQDGQNTDDDDGDQHQDQRVLDQTLSILFGEETAKHCSVPFEI